MVPDTEFILRLLIAAALGMIIGFERERQNQPAGLRTHTILAIGSCLAMTMSINLSQQFAPTVIGDPARLAAQVISGIGFLGAGAILRYGTTVKGLTTATSLWTMAIVGLAVGAGHYFAAVASTAAILIVLTLLNLLEKKAIRSYTTINIVVTAHDQPDLGNTLHDLMKSLNKNVLSTSLDMNLDAHLTTVTLVIKAMEDEKMEDLNQALGNLPGITHYRIN
jgi:putative Mg2+ transporter-C (MgtC) family protein